MPISGCCAGRKRGLPHSASPGSIILDHLRIPGISQNTRQIALPPDGRAYPAERLKGSAMGWTAFALQRLVDVISELGSRNAYRHAAPVQKERGRAGHAYSPCQRNILQ